MSESHCQISETLDCKVTLDSKFLHSTFNLCLFFFFWGGSEDHGKIPWINWNIVRLKKEYGGLAVRQLREFNLSLLGKWCWRMLIDREGYWYRVFVARYGEEAGRLEVGGRSCFSWWREVARIMDDVDEEGDGWFAERVSKKLGDGVGTFFWYDRWLGGIPLRIKFLGRTSCTFCYLSLMTMSLVSSQRILGGDSLF